MRTSVPVRPRIPCTCEWLRPAIPRRRAFFPDSPASDASRREEQHHRDPDPWHAHVSLLGAVRPRHVRRCYTGRGVEPRWRGWWTRWPTLEPGASRIWASRRRRRGAALESSVTREGSHHCSHAVFGATTVPPGSRRRRSWRRRARRPSPAARASSPRTASVPNVLDLVGLGLDRRPGRGRGRRDRCRDSAPGRRGLRDRALVDRGTPPGRLPGGVPLAPAAGHGHDRRRGRPRRPRLRAGGRPARPERRLRGGAPAGDPREPGPALPPRTRPPTSPGAASCARC